MCGCESHHLHVYACDYSDIRLTLIKLNTGAFVATYHAYQSTMQAPQECGQILEKPPNTVNGVPLTKISLWAPLVAHNYLLRPLLNYQTF